MKDAPKYPLTRRYFSELRAKLKVTQKNLAARLGTNRFNIANYECGRATPPGEILLKIQKIYPNQSNEAQAS